MKIMEGFETLQNGTNEISRDDACGLSKIILEMVYCLRTLHPPTCNFDIC